MGRSSYSELAQMLKEFLEKIIMKSKNEVHHLEEKSSYKGITLDLQKQIEAINTRVADAKNRMNKLNGIQRLRQKKIETKLPDGSKILQVNSQLSNAMHNLQTMNEYNGKIYYKSILSSNDGKISYEETLVDDKEASKAFTERGSNNAISYYESDIRIPNTGSKTMLIASTDGEPPMPKEINDESKDIRIKTETEPEKYYKTEETTPIFNKNGKQIGLRTIIRNEEPLGQAKSAIYKETYNSKYGKPPMSIETRLYYDNDGIGVTSAYILENGKMIQSLAKDNKGEIRMKAFDKNSGEYIDGKYSDNTAGIMVYGGTNDNPTPCLTLDISGKHTRGRDFYEGKDYASYERPSDFYVNSLDPFYGNDGYFDIDEDDQIYNEKGTNFGISAELEDVTTTVNWAKTSEYFQDKKDEYFSGVGRLEHNYIREQENERMSTHSQEQKNNESR